MTFQQNGSSSESWHGTTVLAVRKTGQIVIAADGQVSLGATIIKNSARKVKKIAQKSVITGFAGSTADAFTLSERLEEKIDQYRNQMRRACVELAKDWRMDKYLRRLEAMLIVADVNDLFVLTGSGDVLEPDSPVIGIGSGGPYAQAAARALVDEPLSAEEIARKAMTIAAEMCVYTNTHLTLESLGEHTLSSKKSEEALKRPFPSEKEKKSTRTSRKTKKSSESSGSNA